MRRLVDRFVALFSRVRPGEGLAVAILLLDLFVLLTSYYLLKVVREPLILMEGGAEVKSYASAGQAALLVAVVPAYGLLASRVRRMTLVNAVTGLFVGSFVVFWALIHAGVAIGVPFYLWLGIFNMLVVAQFWSLANELFSPAQGKRLFPIIAIGGTVGAIAGSYLAKVLIGALGIPSLMMLAAALLASCIGLTIAGVRAARRAPRGEDVEEVEAAPAAEPLRREGGFKLVATVRYLRLIAIMIVLYNVVNTLGEFILGKVVTERATAAAAGDSELAKQLIGEFYGNFFTWVNVIAAVLQAFVVSRVVKFAGVRVALLILPALALGGYSLLAVAPALLWIKVAKIAENSTDYSLHNTVRQMLWLPTTPEAKYKAKAAIDTFFVRFGDVVAAGVVALGTAAALAPASFAAVNVGLAAVWAVTAALVGRAHDRALHGEPPVERPRPVVLARLHGRAPA